VILADFTITFADFSTLGHIQALLCLILRVSLYPTRYSLARLVFERVAECAVIVESTIRDYGVGSSDHLL